MAQILHGPPATDDLTVIDQSYHQMHLRLLYRIPLKSQTHQEFCRGIEMIEDENLTAWCEGKQSVQRTAPIPYVRMILIGFVE